MVFYQSVWQIVLFTSVQIAYMEKQPKYPIRDNMGSNWAPEQVHDDIQTLGKYPIRVRVRVRVMVMVRVQLPAEQPYELRIIIN